jgi:twitching motility protein PilU
MERDQAIKFIHDLLRADGRKKKASDLFITAGFPPAIKLDGKMTPVSSQSADAAAHRGAGPRDHERPPGRRVRGHQGMQLRHQPAGHRALPRQRLRAAGPGRLVLRTINTTIPKLEELGLPPTLKDMAMTKRGLVIVVGATGSGKSTSLAAMIGYRNENSHGHIITIEDPIEYVHEHKNCIVTQREVGVDTDSWEAALKNTLRQAPDVILIGEIRDRETMEHAIAFAETGHLVHVHAARQQRQPGARPHHQLLPGRAPRPAADGPLAQPEGRWSRSA